MIRYFFDELAKAFDGDLEIEARAKQALLTAKIDARFTLTAPSNPLPQSFLDLLMAKDAHPICTHIANMPFNWVPPETSDDPLYIQHSQTKVHVELLGPEGLIYAKDIRIGLYGMGPNSEYGLRTHPAEEVFVMLAGQVDWKRDQAPYEKTTTGQRSYHPSMMPHANRTTDQCFMSAYVWSGDVSRQEYIYQGIPNS